MRAALRMRQLFCAIFVSSDQKKDWGRGALRLGGDAFSDLGNCHFSGYIV